ncbi:reverse transcriptase [Mycena venus]|uniref:Reverse transcriptase n=1 Tax=Mycena venus TaxID=2733690 RepID=A0A8H6Z3A3_9AGAR|nr:reverse transcriptase [Mycena venus]
MTPKAWRPVENYEHILAKPLKRLVADRLSFDAESLGFLEEAQHGSHPGHSTLQAVDGGLQPYLAPGGNRGDGVPGVFATTHSMGRLVPYAITSLLWLLTEFGSALSVILFLIYINRLLRRLKAIGVFVSWSYGFIEDTNIRTASKSASQNVLVLNKAAVIAADWAKADGTTFDHPKSELLHHSPGRADLSSYVVTFDGITIHPSEVVKWVGVWLDSRLTGDVHIKSRAASAVRALNAALTLTHAVWGLKPLMVRDLANTVVLPRADYGVSSLFPLPMSSLKPLERVNKTMARCITGMYRTTSLAALEKEAALLPAPLQLERSLLHRLAGYLYLPQTLSCPRQEMHIAHQPFTSLNVYRLFAGRPSSRLEAPGFVDVKVASPTDVMMGTCVDPEGSGVRGRRGGAVTERYALGLSPPLGDRKVLVTAPPASDAAFPFQSLSPARTHTPRVPAQALPASDLQDPDLTLSLEPIVPIYAPPWVGPLPVNTIIPSQTSALAILKEFLADPRFTSATWFTDGSLLGGLAGGAAVWVRDGRVVEQILLPLGKGQVVEGEIEGLVRATEHALALGAIHILVVSDSQASLQGVLSTSPRSGQFRAIQYDRIVRDAMLHSPVLRITNLWTPAHVGTVGNEFADDAAKTATLLPPPPCIPVSLTTCKRAITELILSRWNDMRKCATTSRGLRDIDNSPPSLILRSPYLSSSARADISILSQLRTDFSSLNAHRFRCRLTASPACDACGAPKETRAHFLPARRGSTFVARYSSPHTRLPNSVLLTSEPFSTTLT